MGWFLKGEWISQIRVQDVRDSAEQREIIRCDKKRERKVSAGLLSAAGITICSYGLSINAFHAF